MLDIIKTKYPNAYIVLMITMILMWTMSAKYFIRYFFKSVFNSEQNMNLFFIIISTLILYMNDGSLDELYKFDSKNIVSTLDYDIDFD